MSNRSEHGHRRPYSDRSSRPWDGYDERWEERRDSHRDPPRDSYLKYGGDGLGSAERTSRSREYSDSPQRPYSKDSLSRDRSRKSPPRRRVSSPERGASDKKRRRFTEDGEDDYRYRREPEENANRLSPDGFPRAHASNDFKHAPPQDFRPRYRQEDFTYRQQHDVLARRRSSGYYKDRDGHERSRDGSQERTRSQDSSIQSYVREENDSPSTDREDHRQNMFPLNGSRGQSFESDVTNHSAAVPDQRRSTQGFQRFLDVLNKGVNVAVLTKIVTQTPKEADDRPHSPTSFVSAADRPWSPGGAQRQQGSRQNAGHWSESEGSQRPASPPPCHRSFSPKGRPLFHEKSLQRGDGEQSFYRSSSRSESPSVVENKVLTPEDEHKHRQMQGVLQAIGINLGFEELGQMSHRIQERLYGKKDGEGGRHRRVSRERDTIRPPRPRSRSSSSSRSSFSPSAQEHYMKEDSFGVQRDVTEVERAHVHQAAEYGQNSSSTLQEGEKCEPESLESPAGQTFPQNPTYTLSEPSPPPVMPMYSPVNCSPLPYPSLPRSLPPVLPPNLPLVGPGLFLPRLPPFLPYPRVPPLNIFPAMLAQTRHLLPPHISNPPPLFNLPDMNRVQPLNAAQKSKTPSRPRCLQVIETKQPG